MTSSTGAARVSANQSYLAFVQKDTNEVQLWDLRGKAKCLARLKPNQGPSSKNSTPSHKNNKQGANDNNNSLLFTVVEFSSSQDSILAAGLSNGSIYIIDCNTAQISKQINQVAGYGQVKAISFFKKSQNHYQALVSSSEQYLVYDLHKQTLIESIIMKKKQQTPDLVQLSHDDLYSIEAYAQQVSLRNIKTKQIIAKYEGHQAVITSLSFSLLSGNNDNSYAFVTAANNECLLWNPKEEIVSAKQLAGQIQEISVPEKILESVTSEPIQQLSAKHIADNVYSILAISDQSINVYFVKSTGGQNSKKQLSATKSRTKKIDCVLKCGGGTDQIFTASVVNESTLSIVNGSLFAMKKLQVGLMDDKGHVKTDIVIGQNSDDVEGKSSKKKSNKNNQNNEDYDVMGIEEEAANKMNSLQLKKSNTQGGAQINLVPEDELDNLESILTSTSSKGHKNKVVAGSLSTVLSQALTSDDTETLDWILNQKDEQMITHTLNNLKEAKYISGLFRQIVIRFQQEGPATEQMGVLTWLKTLLAIHWMSIVKKADKQDLQNLGAIQAYIAKKTKYMDKFLILKGKLEMIGKTLEIKQQLSKIEGAQQKGAAGSKNQALLVYKDADDELDEEMKEDEDMDNENEDEEEEDGSGDEYDDEDDGESDDEEIQELDIKTAKRSKRQKLDREGAADSDNDDEEEGINELDDSIEDEESGTKSKKKKSKKNKKKNQAQAGSDEEMEDYEDSQESLDEDNLKAQLMADSDEEDDGNFDQDDNEDYESDNDEIAIKPAKRR